MKNTVRKYCTAASTSSTDGDVAANLHFEEQDVVVLKRWLEIVDKYVKNVMSLRLTSRSRVKL